MTIVATLSAYIASDFEHVFKEKVDYIECCAQERVLADFVVRVEVPYL